MSYETQRSRETFEKVLGKVTGNQKFVVYYGTINKVVEGKQHEISSAELLTGHTGSRIDRVQLRLGAGSYQVIDLLLIPPFDRIDRDLTLTGLFDPRGESLQQENWKARKTDLR